VERGEFVNAGVILFCLTLDFLAARVQFDEARIRTLAPDTDLDVIRRHLEAIPRICAGDPEAGPIARLTRRERFHWLVAPRSTMIQVSPVHSGVSDSPQRSLNTLFDRLVGL
jgi:hypothetical protein